jgi:ribosomal-protein-alanine N-acetyltransferase
MDTIFRPMTLADVPTVGELEILCFPTPWSPDTYRNELLHNRFGRYWVLAPATGDVEASSSQGTVLPPILAYGGLSERLMLLMIEQCRQAHAALVTLEVRVSNTPAQQLYTKLGFVEVGVRRGYYHDNNEDALLMTLFLKEEEPARASD